MRTSRRPIGPSAGSSRRTPEPTVIVFTSVHGDMHGSHGLFRKGWPHEESVRVPLLVRLPGPPGRAGVRTGRLASLLDLPRWTKAWAARSPAGGPSWKAAAGESPGVAQPISMPSAVRLPHQCDLPWQGVRTARRKLVLGAEGSPWLFFDLERDPGETVNLAGDPSRAAEIRTMSGMMPGPGLRRKACG